MVIARWFSIQHVSVAGLFVCSAVLSDSVRLLSRVDAWNVFAGQLRWQQCVCPRPSKCEGRLRSTRARLLQVPPAALCVSRRCFCYCTCSRACARTSTATRSSLITRTSARARSSTSRTSTTSRARARTPARTSTCSHTRACICRITSCPGTSVLVFIFLIWVQELGLLAWTSTTEHTTTCTFTSTSSSFVVLLAINMQSQSA